MISTVASSLLVLLLAGAPARDVRDVRDVRDARAGQLVEKPRVLLQLLPGGTQSDQIATGAVVSAQGTSPTFTRSSTKLCKTGATTLTSLSTNRLCVDSTGALLEAAHQNMVIRSTDLSTSWSPNAGGLTQTANVGVAPDGTTTAAQLHYPAITNLNEFYIYQGVSVTARAYTSFVWLKGVSTSGTIYLFIQDPTSGFYSTGCAFTAAAWAKCSITWTPTAGTAYMILGGKAVGTIVGQSAQPAQDVYAWGASTETGTYSHSEVSTLGAAVTGAADVLTFATTGFPYAQGSISFDFAPEWAAPAGDYFILGTTDTSFHNGLLIKVRAAAPANGIVLQVANGSTSSQIYDGTDKAAWTPGTKRRIRAVWGNGNAYLYADGVLLASDTTGTVPMPTAANTLTVCALPGGSNQCDGWVSDLRWER